MGMRTQRKTNYGVYDTGGTRECDSEKLLEDRFGRNYRELFDKVEGGYGSVIHIVTINKKFYNVKRERRQKNKN